jgi:phosphonate transport system substrate-binding protein
MASSQRSPLPRAALVVLLAALSLAGCDAGEAPRYAPEYAPRAAARPVERVFGVHPLHNPERLHAVYGPLVAYLNTRVPEARLALEASRNYAAFDRKLYAGRFHFALPNPYQTVLAADRGYRVFGKMADDDRFRGILLVRRDSGIREVSDLAGRAVSFPAPTALAATMLPQYFLHRHGLDLGRDLTVRYVGSQESSIMNVYLGNVAAAATWPPPWETLAGERPELARALEVRWRTQALPNNGLVARRDVPPALVQRIAQVLFHLHEEATGRVLLERIALSRFEPADLDTFRPVRAFAAEFSRTVRELGQAGGS